MSKKLDRENHIPLGLSVRFGKGLSVNKEDAFSLMDFVKDKLSDKQIYLSDNFIFKNISDFLIKAYCEMPKITSIEELIKIFHILKPEKLNIFIKIFNLQTDIEEYDGGSFILYNPLHFIKKYKNYLMYNDIYNQSAANSDNIPHLGLVLKDIEIYHDDKEKLTSFILEKTEEFINFTSVALGEKDKAQKLACNFNHIGMEYHLLDNSMIEKSSSYSSAGSTFLKGSIDLKTELFFNNHEKLFSLLSNRDNELKEKLYKSILWLGKSLRTENISDSFLQVGIALECLLTRTEGYYINPSITYSLSETLTFLVTDNKEDRIKFFKELKKLYGLRSAIVHSGKSNILIQQYNDFFYLVKYGIYKILDLMEIHNFKTIDKIYNYVEELKFQ